MLEICEYQRHPSVSWKNYYIALLSLIWNIIVQYYFWVNCIGYLYILQNVFSHRSPLCSSYTVFQQSLICLFSALMFCFSYHSFACSQHWCLVSAFIHLLVLNIDVWFQLSSICLFSTLMFYLNIPAVIYLLVISIIVWFQLSFICLLSVLIIVFRYHPFACSQHECFIWTFQLSFICLLSVLMLVFSCHSFASSQQSLIS